MIFVTVGTQKFQLNRLLKELDHLVEEGTVSEEIFAQTGHCDYIPKYYKSIDFLSPEEFENKVKECRLLITHSGVATIITGVKNQKPIVVFPRQEKYGEHVDDHQLQIAEEFAGLGYVLECLDEKRLLNTMQRAEKYQFKPYEASESKGLSVLREYLGSKKEKVRVLMVGVDEKRIGGMWTVAQNYIQDEKFREKVELTYVATNTYGSPFARIAAMIRGYWKIVRILRKNNTDIVHIHMAEKGSTYRKGICSFLASLFHVKIIIQLHAGPFMAWYKTQNAICRRMIRNCFKRADKVLVLGDYWKDQLEELVPEDKISILYNGSECPDTNPYNVDGDKLLYMGVMKQAKGTFDLLHAMNRIKDRLPADVKLYLCGTAEEPGIPELIRKYQLEDRVVLTGWISKEERLELFSDACVCVHPSYFEALSMTVIEAMCYGIPVLTTNISTMPELLGDGIPLVEPGDYEALGEELLALVTDREKRLSYSEQLYNRAKKRFSSDINIQNTLDYYEEVLH